MGARGKKSSASLEIARIGGVSAIQRPEPDPALSDEEAVEWDAIVNRLPAEWFPRETWGLLAQYCRHVVSARRVGDLITNCLAADEVDVDQYDRLLKMQEREGRAMSSLATRMRISQQAQYSKDKKKGSTVKKPWET